MRAKLAVASVLTVGAFGMSVLDFAARGFSAAPTQGSHLTHVDWLPASASDVTYYRNGDPLFPMYCYECTLSYDDVLQLAAKNEWKLTEKSPVPLSGRDLLHLPKVTFDAATHDDSYQEALEYVTEQRNGGGIHVVYHRPTSRLFVYDSAN